MHIVECDPDVILMSSLTLIPQRRIEHGHGKHRVLRRLLKHSDSIGMIDEDPLSTQPQKYLQRFVVVDNSEENRIRTLRYAHGNDRLIVLCPRLEEWVIESCRRIHVELRRYNLSDNGNQPHEEINFKLDRFQQLVARARALRKSVDLWKQRCLQCFIRREAQRLKNIQRGLSFLQGKSLKR